MNIGRKLSDEKVIWRKGRLAGGKIDACQNQYGMAVQENLDDVEEMAISVKVTLNHPYRNMTRKYQT